MTREDRDLFRGWQAAEKGLPPDPYEAPAFLEGYAIGLATVRDRRIRKALANIKLPPPPRRH